MSRLTLGISWFALLAALAACDRQVDAEYQGESLMRIRASVAIPVGLEGADLVPAIAFESLSPPRGGSDCWRNDHKRFVEVGVTGDFPSNFTLDVFDPPPAEAMRATQGGPKYAIGTVTALPRNHPEGFITHPLDNDMLEEWTAIEIDTCYAETEDGDYMPRYGTSTCWVLHACTLDGERCLHSALSCEPTGGYTNLNDCEVVSTEGDVALGTAGYSVNYSLVYFDGPVAANSPLANVYAGGEAISAGYHLYNVQLTSDATPPACTWDAYAEAAERYNEEHGTDWSYGDFFSSVPPAEAPPTLEERAVFFCEYSQVLTANDCRPVEQTFEEVGQESISIELGAPTARSFDFR